MKPLSINDQGDGMPIVLLHGFCESKKIWAPYEALLSVNYRVISLDLPGFGENDPLEADTSIDSMADEVVAALGSLNLPKFLLVGHSLGGYVSLSLAEKHPEWIKGMVLFHSTAFADGEEKKQNRTRTIQFVEKHGGAPFVQALFPPLFSAKSQREMSAGIQYLIGEGQKTAASTIMHVTAAMRDRPDRTALLGQLPFPIMYLIGKEDAAVPLEQSLRECHLPKDATVHILENVGHMGMIEAREKSLRKLQFFAKYCFE